MNITKAPANPSKLLDAFVIFIAGLLVFTTGLAHHEFVQFESRFGLFAQEMFRNGISFFPTTYNKFYPDYPATQTILTYLFSLPFGKVTFFTTMLPTALASALTLVFIYLIGALQARRWGIYSVLFALFTFNFLQASRTISLDQFTTLATTASFYFAYSTETTKKRSYLWLVPLAWLTGFLFRGPIGLIIPASVTCCFYLFEKNIRLFILMAFASVILLVICMAGLLAAAWHAGGQPFMQAVIHMQATNRVDTVAAVPFYYYFSASFIYYAISFPIAAIVLITHIKYFTKAKDAHHTLLKHLACWLLLILIGMSIPSDKKMRYILPIVPAIALSAAYLYYKQPHTKLLAGLRSLFNYICQSLPVLGIVAATGCFIFSYSTHIPLLVPYINIFITCSLLIIATIACKKQVTDPVLREFIILCTGLAAFIVIYAEIGQSLDMQFNRAKPFVTQVETIRHPEQKIVFYKIGPDGEDIKFMVALDKPLQPVFLQDPNTILNFKEPAIFIAKDTDFLQLPDNIKQKLHFLFEGHLGHQDCFVFSRK